MSSAQRNPKTEVRGQPRGKFRWPGPGPHGVSWEASSVGSALPLPAEGHPAQSAGSLQFRRATMTRVPVEWTVHAAGPRVTAGTLTLPHRCLRGGTSLRPHPCDSIALSHAGLP